MSIQLVFETHSTTEENEARLAAGWMDGRLSERGRTQAAALGSRRRRDGIAAVFTSDLGRAMETARIAFEGEPIPRFIDWRLRECDYGQMNGRPSHEVHQDRLRYLDGPYPGGESWRQAVQRVERFLPDLRPRWENRRVLVIGHLATRFAFQHRLMGVDLEQILQGETGWQPGWEFVLP